MTVEIAVWGVAVTITLVLAGILAYEVYCEKE